MIAFACSHGEPSGAARNPAWDESPADVLVGQYLMSKRKLDVATMEYASAPGSGAHLPPQVDSLFSAWRSGDVIGFLEESGWLGPVQDDFVRPMGYHLAAFCYWGQPWAEDQALLQDTVERLLSAGKHQDIGVAVELLFAMHQCNVPSRNASPERVLEALVKANQEILESAAMVRDREEVQALVSSWNSEIERVPFSELDWTSWEERFRQVESSDPALRALPMMGRRAVIRLEDLRSP